ncbi:MAG: ATP-grasp domain-containing protein [Hyphomicrobiales bacterium]
MPTHDADIALLTDPRFAAPEAAPGDWYRANILLEDRLLADALRTHGLSAKRVDWSDPGVDWTRFRAAVFRTTWDYFDRFDEFTAWLERAERATRLINTPSIVRWNMDKHYFADLEGCGIPVVASRYIARGATRPLAQEMEEAGWADAIVKPCVSGGARDTFRIDRDGAVALEPRFRTLVAEKSFLLQPFMRDIVTTGEDTVVVLGGHVTHAVRKKAKAGDFRVQDDHGGTVHAHEAAPDQVALAERAMAAVDRFADTAPVYGRVDMVRDDDGRLAVMELELLEPELWMRTHPPAAVVLGEALARTLAG